MAATKVVQLPPADIRAQDRAWQKAQRELGKRFPPQPFVIRIVTP